MRKTKIVCTLGPASRSPEIIEQLLKAGMNVARMNFSHGTHDYHRETVENFRTVRDRLGLSAAVLLDTKGPEIRLGDFADNSVMLEDGAEFTLTSRNVSGDASIVSVTYTELPAQLNTGDKVLLNDGNLELRVESSNDEDIICSVVHGGKISSHKGVNIPGVHIEMPYMSEQDKSDVLFGIELDVDYIAASFVRHKDDVIELRRFLDYHGGHDIKIISKIENNEGVDNFEEILQNSDGIMVARGDMGVEVEYERLPGIQKRFIKRCRQVGKPVITATQMLESMINHTSPTRAEINDVANAVFDGTSAVMLSGETAAGKYPVLAVEAMSRIAAQAEHDCFEMDVYKDQQADVSAVGRLTREAICDAACRAAVDLNARAIIAITRGGSTAISVSKFRPHTPVIGATFRQKTFQQLSLIWGITPVLSLFQDNTNDLIRHGIDCAKMLDMVTSGDSVVVTAGVPVGCHEGTNMIKVETVDGNSVCI